MVFTILRGRNGRSHEVDLGEGDIAASLHASAETLSLGKPTAAVAAARVRLQAVNRP